jgi:hypothetical protein
MSEHNADTARHWATPAQLARVIVYLGEIAQGPFPEDVQDCIEWAKQLEHNDGQRMAEDTFLALAKSILGNCHPAPTNEEMALRIGALAALVSIAQSLSQSEPIDGGGS